ncbi:MAG: hypothetical protein M1820_003621 [Bogoriella megaspora]|nr:MAG: hypothetical protein M1820_003621 [Bogoriella megaspora]
MSQKGAVRDLLKEKRGTSPLWHRALERYKQELDETDDYQIIQEVHSLDDLLQHVGKLHAVPPREGSTVVFLNRLGPKLKFVDDFSAIIAVCFGANTTLTGLVWGSIRLILMLASSAGDSLQDILDMLEELSLTLPRLKVYEDTLPMNRDFESSLVDLYSEVICFYARAIQFFRSHPHVLLQQHSWQKFRTDFTRTVLRIKRMSATVETEADRARMRGEKGRYKEVLELMDALSAGKALEDTITRFYHLPFAPNNKFRAREDVLQDIQETLDPDNITSAAQSLALFGMGGVGKTQIAMKFAHRSLERYDVVLWIAADNIITMNQSFCEIAKGLQLIMKDENSEDATLAMVRVKNWLSATKSSWLLIFDNVEDLSTLRLAWPTSTRGAILLTTRDFYAANSLANKSLQVQPFDEDAGVKVLLHLVGIDEPTTSEAQHARAINCALGGLPLALGQIGGFIRNRRLPLKDFLTLYERNADRIDTKKSGFTDYEHTLSTVWEVSFAKLPLDSTKLLHLLAFFNPDAIHEQILLNGSQEGLNDEFAFLQDEIDLCEAEEPLLRGALINKMEEEPSLSIHRLMQSSTMRAIPDSEHVIYFDTAVRLLSWGFPNTWNQDIGHQIQTWEKCEKCLPHIHHLTKMARQYNVVSKDLQSYGELLLRCSWYLYEREMYDVCRKLVDAALNTFQDKRTLAYASALDLSGLVELDLNKPESALEPFEIALSIRKAALGSHDPLIAFSLNNIALAYTEMGKLDEAYEVHQEAINIRLRNNSDRIGNSYSNMSSLLLRMGKPNEAEEMLAKCPSLKDFTDETFLNTGNPRFSGDMVLLSRIRLRQGRFDDAMRLASKALTFRQKLLGNRLKTCDSLYDVASLLCRQDKKASTIDLLNQLAAIAETLPGGEGQLARANYKLSVLYDQRGDSNQSHTYKEQALEARARFRPQAKDAPFEEDEFSKLCLWMLW